MFPSALAEKEFHAKKMHCVYSVCKKCGLLVLASDMDYHKEHIHPESKIQCYHGSIFDFDKEGEKHLKKHRVKCWMCCGKAGKKSKRGFKIGHMSHDHKCGQNCRPIVTTEAVWEWQCADDCPNRVLGIDLKIAHSSEARNP